MFWPNSLGLAKRRVRKALVWHVDFRTVMTAWRIDSRSACRSFWAIKWIVVSRQAQDSLKKSGNEGCGDAEGGQEGARSGRSGWGCAASL